MSPFPGDEVDRISFRRQSKLFHLQVKTFGQFHADTRSAVVTHQSPAIGLKTLGSLRTIDIVVCGGGFHLIRVPQECEFFSVRRNRVINSCSRSVGWRVKISWGQIVWPATVAGDNKNMGPLYVAPLHPVPVEQSLHNVCFYFVLFGLFVTAFVAIIVFAVRIDFGTKGNPFSIIGPHWPSCSSRDAGDLLLVVASFIHNPDLIS